MTWESATAGRLGEQLVQRGVISRMQLVEVFVLAQASGHPLEKILLDHGYVTSGQLEQARLGLWRLVEIA